MKYSNAAWVWIWRSYKYAQKQNKQHKLTKSVFGSDYKKRL